MMTPEQRSKKIDQLNELETKIINELSKFENSDVLIIFLAWQECRNELNIDFTNYIGSLVSK